MNTTVTASTHTPRTAARLAPLVALLGALVYSQAVGAAPAGLNTYTVQRQASGALSSHEGVVEAVRQSVLAAQVAGSVVALSVKAGDTVQAGQVLARIDSQSAQQGVAASNAQAHAAKAQWDLAQAELARKQALFAKHYIAKAALDQAQAAADAARAQYQAQQAQTQLARTQSDFFVLRAPYAGVVAQVSTELGDMVMPGRPLITVYAPGELRVTASVPQSVNSAAITADTVRVSLNGNTLTPTRVQVLPTVDPQSLSRQVRVGLPADSGATPGQFALVSVNAPGSVNKGAVGAGGLPGRVFVPVEALVRRGEMSGVYVLSADSKPLLRQVRLGERTGSGNQIEVLGGLDDGERVVLAPSQATRSTPQN